MDKPLYCFRLDKETGKITRYTIEDYEDIEVSTYTHRRIFKFVEKLGAKNDYRYTIKHELLDRFVTDKVFTFNPDIDRAYGIINYTIKEKLDKSQTFIDKYTEILHKIEANR